MSIFTNNLTYSKKFAKYSNIYASAIYVIVLAASFLLPNGDKFLNIQNEGFALILVTAVVALALNIKRTTHHKITSKDYSHYIRIAALGMVGIYALLGVVVAFNLLSYNTKIVTPDTIRVTFVILVGSAHSIKSANFVEKGKDYGYAFIGISLLFLTFAFSSSIQQVFIYQFSARLGYYSMLEILSRRKPLQEAL